MMGERYKSISECSSCTLTTIPVNWTKYFWYIVQYLETACIHLAGPLWVDKFFLPTHMIYQFERAEWEGEVQLEQLTMK